jgi:hypothetical protein
MTADLETTALEAQFVATSKGGIVAAESAGTIVYWYQATVDMFGHSPSEALGTRAT